MERLTVEAYLQLPESMQPMELVYGVVCEPPAPRYGHQSQLTRLAAMLDTYMRQRGLGEVGVAPVDVVLDEAGALVVQPDIVFVSRERLHIVRDRIWGPPDLVVEVLSPGTARRDRTTKRHWYRRYGVAEYWVVDRSAGVVDVIVFRPEPEREARCSGNTPIVSTMLPGRNVSAAAVFA